jgi:DNA-nicking Smr family endonuclease
MATDEKDSDIWSHFIQGVKPLKNRTECVKPAIPKRRAPILQTREWSGLSPSDWMHHEVQTSASPIFTKRTIEARLDLHGYRQDAAEYSLDRFLCHAQTRGMRYVLVITGKGTVLKEHIPLWLQKHPEYVVSFNTAQPKDGGDGALYVHVRQMEKFRKKSVE